MAVGGPVKELFKEATCSICLDYFKDPVAIVECHHYFCRTCLSQSWGEAGGEASCPQCRGTAQQGGLQPYWELAKLAEIAKKFISEEGKKRDVKRDEGVCEVHQQRLLFYCKDEEAPICVVCSRSKQHEYHEVTPLEEILQENWDYFFAFLKILKTKRANLLAFKSNVVKESKDLLKQTKADKQNMVAEFRKLRKYLEMQEKLLVAQEKDVEKELARKRDEHLAKVSEKLSSLESLIQELEKINQKPCRLLQDVRSTLQRFEGKENFETPPMAFLTELKWKIWDFRDMSHSLVSAMKDTLVSRLQLQKANVTLDPDTAHPELILSEDRKSVRAGETAQDLPDNPERFSDYSCVLGCEGFMTGRYFWEVVVGPEKGWAMGVARRSLERKGSIPFSPERGVWVVGTVGNGYRAFSHRTRQFFPVEGRLERIRVALNCDGGQVSFFDSDTAAHLYTFSGANFFGETLQPFFLVYEKGHLRLYP